MGGEEKKTSSRVNTRLCTQISNRGEKVKFQKKLRSKNEVKAMLQSTMEQSLSLGKPQTQYVISDMIGLEGLANSRRFFSWYFFFFFGPSCIK